MILVSFSSVNRVSKPQYLREYSLSFHFCAILPLLNANVFMEESMADGHVETWAVAFRNQIESQEIDGGSEKVKDQDNTNNDIGPKLTRASNDHGEDSSTLVPKTSAVTCIRQPT